MSYYEQGPGVARRIDAQMSQAEQSWNNRFGEPVVAAPQISIDERINERAANAAPLTGAKAMRGSGEGFWSKAERDDRTAEHKLNYITNVGTTQAYDAVKNGFGVEDPYKPSALHRRREQNGHAPVSEMPIEPMPGTALQLPADRPQA